MALTVQEKTDLRNLICSMSITPQLLEEIAAKTDEEVRAMLSADKDAIIASLNANISELQAKLASLQ